ncbi:hypothetical protein C8J56DRAFT_937223 [Mycena floridula]|nr:hypothetical protein C8J56DRAFT_937223 [Mycena floridula]
MSARAPFVPSGKATARAPLKEQTPQFSPDLNNPLHSDKSVPKPDSTAVSNSPYRALPLNFKKSGTGSANRTLNRTPSISRRQSVAVSINTNTGPPTPQSPSRPAFKTPNFPSRQSSPDPDSASNPHISAPDDDEHYSSISKPPQRIVIPENESNDEPQPRLKRTRAEIDEDDDLDASFETQPPKRYKADPSAQKENNRSHNMDYHQGPSFSQHGLSSPLAPSHRSDFNTSPRGPDSFRRQDFAQHVNYQQPEASQPAPNSNSSCMSRLLGQDIDAFLEGRADKYDEMCAKWKDCTMEEWNAGSQELTAKFLKITEFAMKHMSEKLTLFKSFDAQVDLHNTTLKERQKMLEGVTQKLVSDSGNLLVGKEKK